MTHFRYIFQNQWIRKSLHELGEIGTLKKNELQNGKLQRDKLGIFPVILRRKCSHAVLFNLHKSKSPLQNAKFQVTNCLIGGCIGITYVKYDRAHIY